MNKSVNIISKFEKILTQKEFKNSPELLQFMTRILDNYDQTKRFGPINNTITTNHAATTHPSIGCVNNTLKAFFSYGPYAGRSDGISRVASRSGTDSKTLDYSAKVNNARKIIEDFTGIDKQKDSILYTLNSSDALGKLALSLKFKKEDVILLPEMEHTSNFIPWFNCGATVKMVKQNKNGNIDITDLENKFKIYNVKLFTFSVASNISGIIQPVEKLTLLAHKYNSQVSVDCAQFAPHFKMNKKKWGVDYLSYTSHKLGSPIGPGILVVPKKFLVENDPLIAGGGTVDDIIMDNGHPIQVWSKDEAKHQPGTWPTIGIISLAAAISVLDFEKIIAKEKKILDYAYSKLSSISGFTPLFIAPLKDELRTSVISFNLSGYSPDQLMKQLSIHDIQARGGNDDPICNHHFVRGRLGLDGFVRLSFNHQNSFEDIDKIINILNTQTFQ